MDSRVGQSIELSWATDSRDLDALVSLFIDDVRAGRDRLGRVSLCAC